MKMLTLVLVFGLLGEPEGSGVEVVETPDGGVQPQAIVDSSGVTHLVYLKCDPAASDVYYATRKPGESGFGPSIRVNSEAGAAIAMGTIRGAKLAIGREGRVHVAWNGSAKTKPINPLGGSPMLYSRWDVESQRFEPQRNLMTRTTGLDGGGSLATDSQGNVYVAWHGQPRGSTGEGNRQLWVARSVDDGKTFEAERPAWDRPTGACGCCGTAALAYSDGSVSFLYRAATNIDSRDMILVESRDRGVRYEGRSLGPWKINACPMSTASLVDSDSGVLAAWETKGQVTFARVDLASGGELKAISPTGGDGSRKHPALATNLRGETLLAWSEGTAWKKGGSLAWQIFDKLGQPLGPRGRVEGGVGVWDLPSVVARPDGRFAIIR